AFTSAMSSSFVFSRLMPRLYGASALARLGLLGVALRALQLEFCLRLQSLGVVDARPGLPARLLGPAQGVPPSEDRLVGPLARFVCGYREGDPLLAAGVAALA